MADNGDEAKTGEKGGVAWWMNQTDVDDLLEQLVGSFHPVLQFQRGRIPIPGKFLCVSVHSDSHVEKARLRTVLQDRLRAADGSPLSPGEFALFVDFLQTRIPKPAGTHASDVSTVLATHADRVRARFLAAYPRHESLPQFTSHRVVPLSHHVIPANGAAHCVIGGCNDDGASLVLDSWNHDATPAAHELQCAIRDGSDEVHRAMCVGLSGSGKTTAATQLARHNVVIMVTASGYADSRETLPPHYSKDWRQLLELAGTQPQDNLADNELWLRMAWFGLLYTRLVMYDAFTTIAKGTPQQRLQQWFLVQRKYSDATPALASTLQPTPAAVAALVAAVQGLCRKLPRVVVVIDEAQRVNDAFPLKMPRMRPPSPRRSAHPRVGDVEQAVQVGEWVAPRASDGGTLAVLQVGARVLGVFVISMGTTFSQASMVATESSVTAREQPCLMVTASLRSLTEDEVSKYLCHFFDFTGPQASELALNVALVRGRPRFAAHLVRLALKAKRDTTWSDIRKAWEENVVGVVRGQAAGNSNVPPRSLCHSIYTALRAERLPVLLGGIPVWPILDSLAASFQFCGLAEVVVDSVAMEGSTVDLVNAGVTCLAMTTTASTYKLTEPAVATALNWVFKKLRVPSPALRMFNQLPALNMASTGVKGPYFEVAFEELFAYMAQNRVQLTSWLEAIHASAEEQKPPGAASPLKLPEWLSGVMIAGTGIKTETSADPEHNKLFGLLKFRTVEDESRVAIISPSTFAGMDIACCLVRRDHGVEAAGCLGVGAKCYARNLSMEMAMDNANTASFDNAYAKLKDSGGNPSTLRTTAHRLVQECRKDGLHFVTLVVAMPGHVANAAEALCATGLRPGVNVDTRGDVRVLVTLQTLVAAFSLGPPAAMAGVVRGVLSLAEHANSPTGYSKKARAAVRRQLDAALTAFQYDAPWMAYLDAVESAARAAKHEVRAGAGAGAGAKRVAKRRRLRPGASALADRANPPTGDSPKARAVRRQRAAQQEVRAGAGAGAARVNEAEMEPQHVRNAFDTGSIVERVAKRRRRRQCRELCGFM